MSLFSIIATRFDVSRIRPTGGTVASTQTATAQPGWSWTLPLPQVRVKWSLLIATLITLSVLIPIAVLATELFKFDLALWQHMWENTLPTALVNTLWMIAGVGAGTIIIGTGTAWLVTAYDFPGRAWFDQLLLLPLAVPTFVMGFVFIGLMEPNGLVHTQWQAIFGADAWFPRLHSRFGVIMVMTLVLYPYVYILSRAAFREQAATTFEAARVMGYNRVQTFFKLVLPLARPSIAAGTLLAVMEAMTDYGAVQFFDYPTLSQQVVVLWNREYDWGSATQLAVMLLIVALTVIYLERALRGRAKYYQQGSARGRRMQRVPMQGWHKWAATGGLTTLLSLGFFIPVAQLIIWVREEISSPQTGDAWKEVYGEHIINSVQFAGVAAFVVTLFAVLVAYGVRAGNGASRIPRMLSRMVTLGYAMPGAVIAIGVIAVVNPIDADISDFAESLGRTDPSYLLTGTMIAITYAYVVRFMAVGFNSVESSMEKVKPSMEQAARTLGAGSARVLWRIHMPLISTGMAAGAVLVFVDVMKELPITLLLRPFGVDSLAIWAYIMASDDFWTSAAIPSLTIVVVGLIPVFILMRIGDNTRMS